MSAAWPAVRAFAAARWRTHTLTSRARIEAWQTRRMAELLARVLPKSAHLRERFGARGPAAWRSLAPTDKAEMMRRLDDLVTVPVTSREAMELALAAERSRDFAPTLGGVAVGLSSGTSGTRGLFLVSAEERALWAGTVLARLLPDVVLRRHRVAFFLRANSALYETLASRRLRFAYFDLAEPLTSHAEPLRRLDPTVLVAPASEIGRAHV